MNRLSLDPRTKLVLSIAAVAALVLTTGLALLALGLALLVTLVFLLGLSRAWLALLRVLLPMTGFVVVVMLFSFDPATAMATAVRLVAMTTVFFAFFQTTAPEDLGNALVKSGFPYAFSFILTTSMQFVPVLARKMQEVMDAQRARGIRLERDVASLRNYPALFAPLLIQSFTLADQLAEAMEARGFGSPRRTFARDMTMRPRDYGVMLLALALLVVFWLRLS